MLIDDPTAHTNPFLCEIQEWNTEQAVSMKAQLASLEEKITKASNTTGRALSEEAQKKRKEREERKKALAVIAAAQEGEGLTSTTSLAAGAPSPTPTSSSVVTTDENPQAPASSSTTLPSGISTFTSATAPYTITTPASSTGLPWYHDESNTYTTLEDAKKAGIWDYPSNLEERARCGVFRGLWDQGYFMGGGIKFGGEFLVYPGKLPVSMIRELSLKYCLNFVGDPLRYHSHFVASVVSSPTAALRPMEIVAHGRLGTATKKAHLLCGWDDEKKEVSYLSIEWAGFG